MKTIVINVDDAAPNYFSMIQEGFSNNMEVLGILDFAKDMVLRKAKTEEHKSTDVIIEKKE